MGVWSLGIDIAKRSLQVALLMPTGKCRQRRFENTAGGHQELLQWLRKQECALAHACLEATGRYGDAVALALHTAGHQVSVINPRAVHHYAQSKLRRAKTDPVDARLLAEFCAGMKPALWTPPPAEVRALQALVRRLESLQAMHLMEHNRLTSLEQTEANEWLAAQLKAHLAQLEAALQELHGAINGHLESHPELCKQRDRLCSIPGIANITAARILAELGEWQLFRGARQVAAFAGLCPHVSQSGESRHGAFLSRQGNARLRKALYFPALCALRHNPVVKEFGERLRERGKRRMVVVAAAMRKLLHIAFGVLKSGKAFSPELARS